MIILDTNVFSELMKAAPDQSVVAWAQNQVADNLWFTAVSRAEVAYGIARMPSGHRREQLARLNARLMDLFDSKTYPFDNLAADAYGEIVTTREKAGLPIATADAMIAAIVSANRATLATRNTKDFEHTGISLVNPWNPR